MTTETTTCALCGRPTADHDRNIRFRLPDPVLETELRDQAPGVWQTAPDPNESVMLMVPDLGCFLRALLKVQLDGGDTVTFGVWVGVRYEDLQRAFEVWSAPEYVDLRIDGVLANRVAPWEVFGAPVSLAVRDPDHTPYCETSDHPELHRVLTSSWPHDLVLDSPET